MARSSAQSATPTPVEIEDPVASDELLDAAATSPAAEDVQGAPPMLVDEYSGQGGSYTYDSSTGLRTLTQRTTP